MNRQERAARAAAATPIAGGDRLTPGQTVYADDETPLRVAPSTTAVIALRVECDTALAILGPAKTGDGFVWWPVEEPTSGTIGYVRDDFLSADAP